MIRWAKGATAVDGKLQKPVTAGRVTSVVITAHSGSGPPVKGVPKVETEFWCGRSVVTVEISLAMELRWLSGADPSSSSDGSRPSEASGRTCWAAST